MAAGCGGPQTAANSADHPVFQDQSFGRCSTIRLAEVEIRAEIWMSLRRMVPLPAFPKSPLRSGGTSTGFDGLFNTKEIQW